MRAAPGLNAAGAAKPRRALNPAGLLLLKNTEKNKPKL
jgi:hypothetical protein